MRPQQIFRQIADCATLLLRAGEYALIALAVEIYSAFPSAFA